MSYSHTLECEECRALLHELRDAWRLDQTNLQGRLRDAAEASGRDAERMRDIWLSSIANMPSDETRTLMRGHYIRTSAVLSKKTTHEARSGHSVYRSGWGNMQLDPALTLWLVEHVLK